ncbi:hypothetical protein [Kitasatospora sp. GP82]|uniref:hypothetical protein n=1 Tax=Kitasatospora sp. GP82 TaxID=3035089 RepID=UPI002473A530|nr:hypothetical protein [Kitasatospora sp. GP82]MDH6129374.1 hypothetical protein [Kitasatospora sp. GP82]
MTTTSKYSKTAQGKASKASALPKDAQSQLEEGLLVERSPFRNGALYRGRTELQRASAA